MTVTGDGTDAIATRQTGSCSHGNHGFSLCVPSLFSVLLNAIAMTCPQIDIFQLSYILEKLLWQRFSNVIEGANEKERHGLVSDFCLLQATSLGTELLGMSFTVF